MTDAGWAEKRAARKWRTPELQRIYASALKAEYARSVRIVKRAERMGLRAVLDTDTNEYLEGYQQATSDILAALQRGRGGKG